MKFVLVTAWFVVVIFWLVNNFYEQNKRRDAEWRRLRREQASS